MAKTSFPAWGKTRNRQKSAFPHEGKQKISKNQLSLTGENKKSAKIDFPPRGKTKNQRKSTVRHGGKSKNQQKLAFPHEGKSKNAENHSSLVSEMQKTRKTAFRLQATDGKR